MESKRILLNWILLIVILVGCKKENIEAEKAEFWGNCSIKSFKKSNSPFTFQYDAKGVTTGLKSEDPNDLIGGYTFKFEDNKIKNINVMLSQEYAFLRFLYNPYGIRLIRQFTSSNFYDLMNNTTSDSLENSHCEFIYSMSNEPDSMKLEVYQNNFYQLKFNFSYEYDKQGNLVREMVYSLDQLGNKSLDYSLIHAYDSKENGLKQLNYLFFEPFSSAPYLFSKNNKVATTRISAKDGTLEKKYAIKYDNQNNILDDGERFSDIKWTCN